MVSIKKEDYPAEDLLDLKRNLQFSGMGDAWINFLKNDNVRKFSNYEKINILDYYSEFCKLSTIGVIAEFMWISDNRIVVDNRFADGWLEMFKEIMSISEYEGESDENIEYKMVKHIKLGDYTIFEIDMTNRIWIDFFECLEGDY